MRYQTNEHAAEDKQQKIYGNLSRAEKFAVDRALELARKGDYDGAMASFVSDRSKTGAGSVLEHRILQNYADSVKHFKEGLLGFYYYK